LFYSFGQKFRRSGESRWGRSDVASEVTVVPRSG